MDNCITAAFKIKNFEGSSWDLYISPNRPIIEQLNGLMKPLLRSCQNIDSKEFLKEGEWLIAIFGPFPVKYDYEGFPELYDYHFIFFDEEKKEWLHRDGKGKPISPVSDEVFNYFIQKKIFPKYLVAKRVEE